MSQVLSDKKKFVKFCYSIENEILSLENYISTYTPSFKVHRTSNILIATAYLKNLLKCEKEHTNMERMEEIQSEDLAYHQYQHFLSNSKWNHQEVNENTAMQANFLMKDCKQTYKTPTGLIIDESAHLKKGKESVGVARQYAGVAGKVENCQVAVYASLCNQDTTCLIDTALFLPQSWIEDQSACDKAGIPESARVFKTKPQLALDIIKSLVSLGVNFDWIGGDGLYGHNSEFTRLLDEIGLFYVLDIHKDERIYLSEPLIAVPTKKGVRGKNPTQLQANIEPIQVEKYKESLTANQWKEVAIRKTAKGWKTVLVHTVELWHWNGKEEKAVKRTLVITKTVGKSSKTKYSFSNGDLEKHTAKEYAYFQCNRYWVERSFDDAKNELGLSGYQVRGWNAWHHHQALVMMAGLYMQHMKINNKEKYQLMSVRDAKIIIIALMTEDNQVIEEAYKQMKNRHINRKKDIDRHYKEENSKVLK